MESMKFKVGDPTQENNNTSKVLWGIHAEDDLVQLEKHFNPTWKEQLLPETRRYLLRAMITDGNLAKHIAIRLNINELIEIKEAIEREIENVAAE